jgi:antitoxin ParD1/3/4
MTPALPPDLEQFVQDQVANGCFPTSEGVIVAGLRLLREQQAELKTMIAAAVEQADRGEVAPFDPHATLAAVKAARACRGG